MTRDSPLSWTRRPGGFTALDPKRKEQISRTQHRKIGAMQYVIVVPTAPDENIPKGAAVIRRGPDQLLAYSDPAVTFGERCAQALRRGRPVQADEATEIGWFDDTEGEARLNRRGQAILRQWLGHPAYLNDLTARDNQADRRRRARRLTMQGRLAEAYRIDRRLGL
jgi:hypothetical protein